jgi:hypothetical protein
MKTELTNYQIIRSLVGKAMVWADEDEARLKSEDNEFFLGAWLSGEELEIEFIIDGEYEEITEVEETIIFNALQDELESERRLSEMNDMRDTYAHINANFYNQY